MNTSVFFKPFILNLYEGEGAGAAAPAAAEGAAGTPAAPKGGKDSTANVVYGKQDAAPAKPETSTDTETLRKEYRELMQGKFRDIYTEETQRMINRRFADDSAMRQRMEQMQKSLDIVAQRYGIEDGNLDSVYNALVNDKDALEKGAYEAGMSVEQFKEFQRLQLENKALQAQQRNVIERDMQERRAQGWFREAMALKERYPQFDLPTELQDREFVAGLQKGVPMEQLFKAKYFDRFVGEAAQNAAAQAQKATVDNIRAKGRRPSENGATSGSAFTVKDDVSKLTKKDRAEIARRVVRGESIRF